MRNRKNKKGGINIANYTFAKLTLGFLTDDNAFEIGI
jgi:hypothetical protein